MSDKPDPREIEAIVEACRPILAGHHPAVQSAALADLVAIWLAGYVNAPPEFQGKLFGTFARLVFELLPANRAMLAERPSEAETPRPH